MRALVTGASRGIGREIAVGLAGRGWGVGLIARDETALGTVADEVRAAGGAVAVGVADVTRRDQVEAAVSAVEASLGGIDLLVNNAGVIESVEAPFLDTDLEESWRVVEVNVRGPMVVTHAVLPRMLAAGGGRVVNLNSGAGHRAMTVYTGYAVGKGALARFTTQLDTQYRARGLRIFDLAPGHVETGMTTSMPMHDGRTSWTPPEAVVDLVDALGRGRLDAVAGRFVRAGADTVESLLAAADTIVERDARVLRLAPIDDDDPVV